MTETTEATAKRLAKVEKGMALARGDKVAAAMMDVDRLEAQLKAAEESVDEMAYRLSSGTGAPVSRDKYEQAQRDVEYLGQQLTGLWAKVDRAKAETRTHDLDQLAQEIAEFADSTSSPARRAAKAYKAAADSLREALDAVNEHNAAVNIFRARANALDANVSQGPAYPAEAVAFDGRNVVSGPYSLRLLDGHRLASYAVTNVSPEIKPTDAWGNSQKLGKAYQSLTALVTTVSGSCNREVPDAELSYFRTAEGNSVAYEAAPGLVETESRGLKKINHADVWDWDRRVRR